MKSGEPHERIDDQEDSCDCCGREDHLASFFEPGVLPDPAVQAPHPVADEGHDHHDQDEDAEVPAVLGRGDVAPVEDLGRAVRRDHACGVEHHEEEPGAYPGGQHCYLTGDFHGPGSRVTACDRGLRRALTSVGVCHRAMPKRCRGVDDRPRRIKLFPRSPEARPKCSAPLGICTGEQWRLVHGMLRSWEWRLGSYGCLSWFVWMLAFRVGSRCPQVGLSDDAHLSRRLDGGNPSAAPLG